jgi:predicted enzyme related to lactoylglutathione lyase
MDSWAAAAAAEELGATVVADRGHQVMRSPGGFIFCFVQHEASVPPEPSPWPDGHRSTVDQVCIDIPSDHWETEINFWSKLTGWELTSSGDEFARLTRPAGMPLQILLQRLDDPTGDVRAHIDWSSTDRDTEIPRHVDAGSQVVATFEGWTVMRGPGGTYCITARRPEPQPRP